MKALLFLLIAPWTTVLRGLVLVKLWAWFVAPYFHVPYLRIPIALGISSIVCLLTMPPSNRKDSEEFDALHALLAGTFSSLAALGFGAIYRIFL